MNTSRSQLSARKKANTAAGGGDTEGNLTPRPLLAAEELAGAVASGDYELLLVQLPRNLTADKLHDEDLTAGNLFLDGVHLEHRTDRGTLRRGFDPLTANANLVRTVRYDTLSSVLVSLYLRTGYCYGTV